jgi:hypothetical protein
MRLLERLPAPVIDRPTETADRRRWHAFLLASLIASFAVQGAVPRGRVQEVVVTGLVCATVLIALHTARVARRVEQAVLVLAIAVFAVSVVRAATGDVGEGVYRVADTLLVALGPPAVIVAILRDLRTSRQVRVEAVLGVLSLYVLLGMCFAFLYAALDKIGGGPFFTGGVGATASRCLYFSFTTLTTVGYGDLTARSDLGHTLAVSEALVGQVYLVTIVAVIVSNLGRGSAAPPRPS